MKRRHFVGVAAALAATAAVPAHAKPRRIQAVAFDGLALFDARPVFGQLEVLFPGKGTALAAAWRTRLFEYTWLRTLSGSYADFTQVAEDALRFAVTAEKLALEDEQRKQLLGGLQNLKAWPDVAPALRQLKDRGIKLAPLANFTAPMMEAAIAKSGLAGVFDHVLSTDRVRAYKPDPRAYQMGVDAFGLAREEIAFVAFGGWDAAGAKTFGFPTLWVNRAAAGTEQLGAMPDAIAPTMEGLPAFISSLTA